MDIIGVITEYNPFHNGHIYHINKIKELYPNSIIILALNGYFLERGEISIMTKEEKTKMALDYGINLVVEIPFIYGSNSADTFAECGVRILDSLGVNKIVFGSESNDVSLSLSETLFIVFISISSFDITLRNSYLFFSYSCFNICNTLSKVSISLIKIQAR